MEFAVFFKENSSSEPEWIADSFDVVITYKTITEAEQAAETLAAETGGYYAAKDFTNDDQMNHDTRQQFKKGLIDEDEMNSLLK